MLKTFLYTLMLLEYKDYPNGARTCVAIAKKVYQEVVYDGAELCLTLKKKSNFDWTQSPQVRAACFFLHLRNCQAVSYYFGYVNFCPYTVVC